MSDGRDGVVYGTAGGPYCGICGAPVKGGHGLPIPAYPGDAATVPGEACCPNGCGRAYTITVNPDGPIAAPVPVDDTDTAIAAVRDMAIGEILTIRRTR